MWFWLVPSTVQVGFWSGAGWVLVGFMLCSGWVVGVILAVFCWILAWCWSVSGPFYCCYGFFNRFICVYVLLGLFLYFVVDLLRDDAHKKHRG